MKRSLRALMKGLIDYAGLFPPAGLPLDKAIRNYASYREGPEAWMLSRFIIPASQLGGLDPYGEELFSGDPPFEFSVLGKDTNTISEFGEEAEQIRKACEAFHEQHGEKVSTDILEIKLPREAALSGDSNMVAGLLEETVGGEADEGGIPRTVFLEGYFEESWKRDMEAVIRGIAAYNRRTKKKSGSRRRAGFKLRCGGVEAHQFPSTRQLAHSIHTAGEQNVALKCTAGLHHPVRHYNDSVQTKMHGFFNVFGGAMLAYAHDLSDEELEQILSEEDPDQFVFSDREFSWDDLSISTEDITELREVAFTSFGSCSFDEPREDLRLLGLL